MQKYSIVEFCPDQSLIKGLPSYEDIFSELYKEQVLTIYISGILTWHAVEKLLIGKGIIFSGEQLISLFCQAFESTDEILSICNCSNSIVIT